MAAKPLQRARDIRIESNRHNDDGADDENGINNTTSGSDREEEELVVQRVAIGCDDGDVRIYVVREEGIVHEEGMEYYKSFPRVKGNNLGIFWMQRNFLREVLMVALGVGISLQRTRYTG